MAVPAYVHRIIAYNDLERRVQEHTNSKSISNEADIKLAHAHRNVSHIPYDLFSANNMSLS